METTPWASKSLVGKGGVLPTRVLLYSVDTSFKSLVRDGGVYQLLARALPSPVDTILWVFKLGGGREWVMYYQPESCLHLWILSSAFLR